MPAFAGPVRKQIRACHLRDKESMPMIDENPISRRSILKLIGASAGSAAMYQAMTEMGYAATSDFAGPIKLAGTGRFTAATNTPNWAA